ncbi:unnamed protein product [Trichobilharzia regenti]|nr:unnamed protein product [Trichobilharzia regenti]
MHRYVVDLLQLVEIDKADSHEVTRQYGFCPTSNENTDTAYSYHRGDKLKLPAVKAFHLPFPQDFSILATVRLRHEQNQKIFDLTDDKGETLLAVSVGNTIALHYHLSGSSALLVVEFTGVRLNTLRWHRIAFSIKGDSVTLLLDCKVVTSMLLNRSLTGDLKLDNGMLYVLQAKNGQSSFTGAVEQLLIIPTPSAAYDQCDIYSPCNDLNKSGEEMQLQEAVS